MAEMLVRVVDKVNPDDPRKDARLTKRGDVIVVQPDGWAWTATELAGDPWIVVKVPGVPESDLSAYLMEEPEDLARPKLLQRRAFKFDIDAHDGKPLNRGQVMAMRRGKPVRPDPDVLG